MTELRQLTPQEVMFVGGESAKLYQHTGGLSLLDASDSPGFGFAAFRRHIEERIGSIPNFRWKLHEVPLGLDLPYWVEDEDFSFDHHIRRIAVPSPGDHRALAELVSCLYCRHLDRNRPLWETWFIEGLGEGQYALFQKLHHCLMDGAAAVKFGEVMVDYEPGAVAPRKLDPSIAGARAGRVPALWEESLNAARRLTRLPIGATWEISRGALRGLRQRMTANDARREKVSAPLTSFNADIGSDRGFVFGSLPLADVKAVKNHFDVSVNDVVLALVGGSLRAYLARRKELPGESLRASMAVSLRAEGDESFGNKVTARDVTLGTNVAEPRRRLQAIAAETGAAKTDARGGGNAMESILPLFPPALVKLMLSALPPDTMMRVANSNVFVSNVRGSPRPTYLGGARIAASYPMSVITPGVGINVTCMSYVGRLDFGITVSPELFSDPWLIVEGMQAALDEYVALAAKSARRARPRAVEAKAAAKPRRKAARKA